MPLISELHDFPFISDEATAEAGNDPYEVLKKMVGSNKPFVFPKEGSYWFCAGMTISAFEVREIYFKNYWLAASSDLLPEKLALVHFDWAVNAGCDRAIKTLQQVVNASPDGIVGPNTKSALALAIRIRCERSLVVVYCSTREVCYRRWGVGSQKVFLTGWLNRLNSLREFVA